MREGVGGGRGAEGGSGFQFGSSGAVRFDPSCAPWLSMRAAAKFMAPSMAPAVKWPREPVVMGFPAWLETLPPGEIEFISTDFTPFRAALEATRFRNAKMTTAPRALAAVIGAIAHERFRAGRAQDPAEIDADYVRRSDAELFWKEM